MHSKFPQYNSYLHNIVFFEFTQIVYSLKKMSSYVHLRCIRIFLNIYHQLSFFSLNISCSHHSRLLLIQLYRFEELKLTNQKMRYQIIFQCLLVESWRRKQNFSQHWKTTHLNLMNFTQLHHLFLQFQCYLILYCWVIMSVQQKVELLNILLLRLLPNPKISFFSTHSHFSHCFTPLWNKFQKLFELLIISSFLSFILTNLR